MLLRIVMATLLQFKQLIDKRIQNRRKRQTDGPIIKKMSVKKHEASCRHLINNRSLVSFSSSLSAPFSPDHFIQWPHSSIVGICAHINAIAIALSWVYSKGRLFECKRKDELATMVKRVRLSAVVEWMILKLYDRKAAIIIQIMKWRRRENMLHGSTTKRNCLAFDLFCVFD